MSANFPRSSNRAESTEDGGCIAGMLQCPICLRQLDDPRSLPCLHTYCRRCLAAQWPDRQPGERLSCPVCRAVFDVPQSGLADLPHNFFLQQLIDERRSACSSSKKQQQQQYLQQQRVELYEQQSMCDVCSTSAASFLSTFDREAVSRPKEIAIIYCSDCRLKLCGSCLRRHVGQTDAGSHRLQSLSSTPVADADVDVVPAPPVVANLINEQQNCDKHPGRVVELYCFDCKTNVCLMCFAVDHRFHDCQQLNQVADSFRCRMETDEQTLLFRVVDFRKRHRRLETNRSRLVDGLLDIEDVIRRRADELKRTLDSQVKDMMRQIQGVRVDSLKKFDSDRKAIDKTVLALELHCRESKRVRIQGKPCDVAAAADLMHAKAQQLLLTSHSLMVDEFKPPKVVFLPGCVDSGRRDETSRSDVDCTFVLGNLTIIEPGIQEAVADEASEHHELANDRTLHYKKRPLALMSIKMDAGNCDVTGLTQLDDFLYVVISKSSIVHVLSSSPPYHKLAAFQVDGLEDPSDIAICTLTKQLYIADNGVNSCCLWRLEPTASVSEGNGCVSTGNNSECLAVERRPSSLSITSGRLLVTPHAGNRLYIHSTADGQLLKQVRLSYYVEPYHAVESLRGTYFVSHGGHYDANIGQVSEVDDKGRTLRTYGKDAAATATATGRIDLSPFVRLSVDHFGNRLLLQDALSCQVLLLDATTLQFQTVLVTKPSSTTTLVNDATTRFNNVSLTSSSPSTNLKTSRMYLATESGLLFVSRGHQMDIFIVKRFKKHTTNIRRTSQLTANTLQVGDLTLRCDNTSVVS